MICSLFIFTNILTGVKYLFVTKLYICKTVFNSLHVVVPVLSYLLMKEDITLEEVNGHAIDVVFAGVDTVRKLKRNQIQSNFYERPLLRDTERQF